MKGTMISYNDADLAWTQRVKKENWTHGELKDFGIKCNGDNLRDKFYMRIPEQQQEMDILAANKK